MKDEQLEDVIVKSNPLYISFFDRLEVDDEGYFKAKVNYLTLQESDWYQVRRTVVNQHFYMNPEGLICNKSKFYLGTLDEIFLISQLITNNNQLMVENEAVGIVQPLTLEELVEATEMSYSTHLPITVNVGGDLFYDAEFEISSRFIIPRRPDKLVSIQI